MPNEPDDKDQQELFDAVKSAIDHVSGGLDPTSAVEKVARDYGFGRGKVTLVANAYNNGTQLAQWRGGDGVLNKLASFPLCDADAVIDRLYPANPTVKSAGLSPSYAAPPGWLPKPKAEYIKLASAPEPERPVDKVAQLDKAYALRRRNKRAIDECEREIRIHRDALDQHLVGLVRSLKIAHDRPSYSVIDTATRTYLGDVAHQFLGMAYERSKIREKAAGDNDVLGAPVDTTVGPFAILRQAMGSVAKYNAANEKLAQVKAASAAAEEEAFRPFVRPAGATDASAVKMAFGFGTEVAAIAAGDILAHKATHQREEEDPYGDAADLDDATAAVRRAAAAKRTKRADDSLITAVEKQAIAGSMVLGGALGNLFGRATPMPKPKSELVEDKWMDLEDPDHANELRSIRTHAMLNQLMTDPDEPISGHDPNKVLAAYNELSQATPRLAGNIAMLRPALRKRLEGHQEPFEAKELLDIEHGLTRTKAPTPNTAALGETPDSLLG